MIAYRREEDLRLVLGPPERLAVDDAVAVDGERHPRRRRLVRSGAPALRAPRGVRSERRALELFASLADAQRRDTAIARELRRALNFGDHARMLAVLLPAPAIAA